MQVKYDGKCRHITNHEGLFMKINSEEFQTALTTVFQYAWDMKKADANEFIHDETIKEDIVEARFQGFPPMTFKRTRHGNEAENWTVVVS